MLREVLLDQVAQRREARGIDRVEEATERGAMGQAVTPEECQEGGGEGREPGEERLQRLLATDGIAEQERDAVNHVVVADSTAGKAHLLGEVVQEAAPLEVARDDGDFREPRGD